MKQLTHLDASFLNLETHHAPMHVGGTFIFQHPADKKMTFSQFREHIQSRLQTSPIFRRRLVEMPLDVDLPYWLEDPHFDVDEHLFRHRLTNGSLEELQQQAEEFFSSPLDREKPLWEVTFVDGLKTGGDFAFIIKIHHCAIDGVSGEEVLVGLLDFSEKTKEMPADTWEPESFPEYSSLVGKKLLKTTGSLKRLWHLAKGAADTANRSVNLRVSEPGETPPLFFSSPETPFNVAVSGNRRLAHIHLPLHQIKEIKSSQKNITVNDVALTICSEALKQLLLNQGALPESSLVAMAPISTREKVTASNSNDEAPGNDVSAMLVSLETNEENMLQRLGKIHVNSRKGKRYNRAVAAEQLLDNLPPMTSALVTKAITKFKASRLLKPIFNTIITNVPGSPVPLYLNGARLLSQSFNAPIYDYTGLTINVTSYVDVLTIGVTTTPEILPDGEVFNRLVKESFSQLYKETCSNKVVRVKPIKRKTIAVEKVTALEERAAMAV
ncbi:MAG: wax ester/triacylglycerol synthase family O-acyltransferase [Pseudomonadales bacterium]|nr:wax ester/triacylglycerol synthase family O-acyltransferase [Pseudomonadales bacterium]